MGIPDVPGHGQGHDGVRHRTESRHPAPVEPVHDVPGDHHEQGGGRELRQTEEAEGELATGQLVYQEAEHSGLGQGRHRRGERRAEQSGNLGAGGLRTRRGQRPRTTASARHST